MTLLRFSILLALSLTAPAIAQTSEADKKGVDLVKELTGEDSAGDAANPAQTRGFKLAATAASNTDKLPNVLFEPNARPIFKLTGGNTKVTDASNGSSFIATADYLASVTNNRGSVVYEWNPRARTIRVSEGGKGYWLDCTTVVVAGLACSSNRLRVTADGTILVSRVSPLAGTPVRGMAPTMRSPAAAPSRLPPGLGARGIPNCPGDPRCPKL